MRSKKTKITIADTTIRIIKHQGQDYICLTDMVKNYGGDAAIYSWMRNRNTVEFLGVWELLNNSPKCSLALSYIKRGLKTHP